MYRGCVSSPVSSHHSVLKMPGLTGSSGRTLSTYRTTYNSSYISPPTSSNKVYRTPVTQRKTYTTQCGIGSTGAGSGAVSYTRSRALPSGPGPLSSDGTSRLPPSFSLKPRASSVVRTGPVKADYSRDYTRSYGNYRSTNKSSSDSIPDISLSSRKSSSMLDLSGLSLDRDRVDKLDHINNNSTPSKSKYDSYHYGSSSRSSSRARLYETNATGADYSTSDGISSHGTSQRRTSLSTRETVGVDGRTSPSLRADRGSPSSKTDPTRPPSQRRDSVSSTSGRRLIDDRTSNDASNSHNNKISTSLNHLRGKLGLRNLGNTCFMNAVLQSLSNTQPLLDYCLNEDYHLELNKSNSSMKGGLFVAYVNLMKSLWSDKSDSYVSPNNFKTQVQRFAPRFMGYQQQDAQEFLRYLLEGLHEDVNRVRRSNKQSVANEEEEDRLSDSEKAKEYWQRYLKRDDSKIVDMFVGQLKSELRFEECSHKSVTFDPYWDLSLPIPKGRTNVTLQDCIGLFMKEEELDAEERPTCFKCKERRACKKAFSIQRFPKILVLHLKRFSQEMYGRKLTTLVEFPVTGLDLTEFSAQTGGPRVLYNLYAVCNHSGGTHSGHYTAHCKHPYSHEWNFFNDTRLTRTNGQNAVSAEAYVLFYELSNQSSRL